MKNLLSVFALLTTLHLTAQNVTQAEYFIDIDAGFGNNTIVSLNNPQPDGNYDLNINLSGVSSGNHKLYIRTKDSNGKWSHTTRRNIEVVSANMIKQINGGEYFLDIDPGFNAALPVTINNPGSVVLQNFTAATDVLALGNHKLYIRLRDNDSNWSLTTRRNVEVIKTGVSLISGAEYFFKTDSGFGSANPVTFATPAADGSFTFNIPLEKIPVGAQTLYIRAKDSPNNNWSITQWQKDSVITSSGSDSLWSHPATWSNNKVPDASTVVVLRHKVYVDINTANCKSLTPYRADAQCIVMPNMKVTVVGHR